MEIRIDHLLSAIKTNSRCPISYNATPKLPIGLASLSEEDLACALTESYRSIVNQRGLHYEDISEAEMSQKIRYAVTWMKAPAYRSCLLLQGVPGTGKTTLLWAISALFGLVNASQLYINCQKLFESHSLLMSGTSATYNEYKTAKRLFIDDMGIEPSRYLYYGVEFLPIQEVLTYRHERQLPTIITTNLSDSMIRERYGERISDRFSEMCTILRFSGKSYRQ